MGFHKPVLKTTLNPIVRFQKCATHRVVSGVRWCAKSSIVSVVFYLAFCESHWNGNQTGNGNGHGLFTFNCIFFAQFFFSTVGLEQSEKTRTPLSVSGQRAMSLPTEINGFTKRRTSTKGQMDSWIKGCQIEDSVRAQHYNMRRAQLLYLDNDQQWRVLH